MLWPFIIYILCFFMPITSKAQNNIFYIIVLLPFLFWVKKDFILGLFRSRIMVFAILFTLYLTIRSLFFVPFQFGEAIDPVRHFISFSCFFALCTALFYKTDLEVILNRVTIWAAVYGIGSSAYFFFQNGFNCRLEYMGPVSHPIIGASVYALTSLFALLSNSGDRHKTALTAGFLLFICVIFSGSRGPLIALIAAALTGAVLTRRKWPLSLFFLLGSLIWLSYHYDLLHVDRLIVFSSSYRFDIWAQVIGDVWKNGNWVLGNSLLADRSVAVGGEIFAHAHSGYISTLFQGGVVGLLLLLILIGVAGWHVVISRRRPNFSFGISLWIFTVLIILTDNSKMLDGPGGLWFYFWLPLAFLSASELNARSPKKDYSGKEDAGFHQGILL